MDIQITGNVSAVLPIQRGTSKAGKEWAKATVILEVANGQYSKKIAVENMRNAEAFASLTAGSEVTLDIDIESREFNGRWYTTITCWRWKETPTAAQQAPPDGGVPF